MAKKRKCRAKSPKTCRCPIKHHDNSEIITGDWTQKEIDSLGKPGGVHWNDSKRTRQRKTDETLWSPEEKAYKDLVANLSKMNQTEFEQNCHLIDGSTPLSSIKEMTYEDYRRGYVNIMKMLEIKINCLNNDEALRVYRQERADLKAIPLSYPDKIEIQTGVVSGVQSAIEKKQNISDEQFKEMMRKEDLKWANEREAAEIQTKADARELSKRAKEEIKELKKELPKQEIKPSIRKAFSEWIGFDKKEKKMWEKKKERQEALSKNKLEQARRKRK
jgi:hypothetical protein